VDAAADSGISLMGVGVVERERGREYECRRNLEAEAD
jgi:hypothetical protein